MEKTRITQKNRVALWLFLSLLTLHLAITRGHFISIDEVNMYQMTQSLWERGELAVNPILHSFSGRDGKYYSQYNIGLSVAAVPLYALGKVVREWLSANGHEDWLRALAGTTLSVAGVPALWGGEVEIFFVNLFNCFTTALLCMMFFLVCSQLGASIRNAALVALLVGTVSHVAPFSVSFYQHTSEALCLLSAFYFLLLDQQRSRPYARALAGLMLGLALTFRQPAAIAWPVFSLYMLWIIWQRHKSPSLQRLLVIVIRAGWPPVICRISTARIKHLFMAIVGEGWPFALPMIVALIGHFLVNYLKYESFFGNYHARFGYPLLAGIYSYLFSPGLSVFLFTPLLLVLPWTFAHFWRQWRPEAVAFISLAVCFFGLYGTFAGDPDKVYNGWGWAYGPRYMIPLIVLLLLPLAAWLDVNRWRWLYALPLLLMGLWMQITHIAVNFIYTAAAAGYDSDAFKPEHGFIFIPDSSPLVFMSQALLSGDYRVDMWLVNIYRQFGFAYLWMPLLAFSLILILCSWRLYRHLYPTVRNEDA